MDILVITINLIYAAYRYISGSSHLPRCPRRNNAGLRLTTRSGIVRDSRRWGESSEDGAGEL